MIEISCAHSSGAQLLHNWQPECDINFKSLGGSCSFVFACAEWLPARQMNGISPFSTHLQADANGGRSDDDDDEQAEVSGN